MKTINDGPNCSVEKFKLSNVCELQMKKRSKQTGTKLVVDCKANLCFRLR